MKKLLTLVLITFFCTAHAEDKDFEYIENNLTLEHGSWELQGRDYIDKDYTHYEVWYTPLKDILSVAFRYTDEGKEDQYRVSATLDMFEYKYFEFTPRIEYIWKDEGEQDISRFRAPFIVQYPWGKWEPWARYEFYTDISNQKLQQTRANFGIKYNFTENVVFGPYLEQRWDDDWNKKFLMVATRLEIAF